MKSNFILDPLWINMGSSIDPEYFDYILLDVYNKHQLALESMDISNFDELFFHILNLNNLIISGSIFTAKFKELHNVKRLYGINHFTLKKNKKLFSVVKNANYVFLNILVDYMNIQLDILKHINTFYKNKKIHSEKTVFIILNKKNSDSYSVWKLKEDFRKNFGYSFTKEISIQIKDLEENIIVNTLKEKEKDKFKKLSSKQNVFLVSYNSNLEENLIASVIKDVFLLNKGIGKNINFEPKIISELYQTMWIEKVIPYTLDQWAQV